MIEISDVRINGLKEPVGVNCCNVQISWKIRSDENNVEQKSFHAKISDENKTVWDSGLRNSDSLNTAIPDLPSKTRFKAVVTLVVNTEGKSEEITASTHFVTGLSKGDAKAVWIEPHEEFGENERKPSQYLRKVFVVKKGLKRATVYQSAHGLYEFYINGVLGTDEKFLPGLTSYYHRIQIQTYDVTNLMTEGLNVWAVMLGDGWWRGATGGTVKNNFGYKLAFWGQLELQYTDGTNEIICSGDSFRCSTGGLIASDMQMGEIYDANKEPFGWKSAGFDDCKWGKCVKADEYIGGEFIGKCVEAVKEKETFNATLFRDAAGDLIADFGQNIAGYVKIKIRGCKKGQKIVLTHGEDLKDGVFSMDNINKTALQLSAFQEITYICAGDIEEVYYPHFAVFGFRYVKIQGCDDIGNIDLIAVAVYSDYDYNGTFECSNPLINKLVENSRWSQKSNFLDVPTDCPTRERNSWTGDAQVYAVTAHYFGNVHSFFSKWLTDMRTEQYASGKVGITAPSTSSIHNPIEFEKFKKNNPLAALAGPDGNGSIGEDCAGWGDAIGWIPYVDYLFYGDKNELRKQYPAAKKWVDYMLSNAHEKNPLYETQPQYSTYTDGELDADYIYDTRMHYGEWQEPIERTVDLDNKESLAEVFMRMIREGKPLVATAYMCRSARNVAQMAKILGYDKDEAFYNRKADKISEIYDKYFISDDGVIEAGHQAAYVRALVFGLCSSQKRGKVLSQLITEIEKNGFRLNTGFLSTPFLLPVLADNGYADIAYKILESTEYPSWLYSVINGATTITESWHSTTSHEGSFNHYSYGAVCEFLFGYVAGIRYNKGEAGMRTVEINPVIGGSLTYAKAGYESPYGTIRSEWHKKADGVQFDFEIPVGITAKVYLPDKSERILNSGKYTFNIKC